MAREGTYPLPSAMDGTAQLFSSRRVVTAVPREMDCLNAQLAAPSVIFARGPPEDDQALPAWAQLLTEGEMPKEGHRFAASVRMAPLTHTSAHAEFNCAYCWHPCKGWEDHMVRSYPVVVACLERFQGHVRPTAVLGLCRVLARFPGRQDLRQGRPHLALATGAGRGRGRTVRERRLGRGRHMVRTPMGRGPIDLASPRACRLDGGIPPASGGLGGTFTARPVVTLDAGRGERLAGGPLPPPHRRAHPTALCLG